MLMITYMYTHMYIMYIVYVYTCTCTCVCNMHVHMYTLCSLQFHQMLYTNMSKRSSWSTEQPECTIQLQNMPVHTLSHTHTHTHAHTHTHTRVCTCTCILYSTGNAPIGTGADIYAFGICALEVHVHVL